MEIVENDSPEKRKGKLINYSTVEKYTLINEFRSPILK